MITRAIGTEEGIETDVSVLLPEQKDIYLMCSDGLTEHVPDERICTVLKNHTLEEAADLLLSETLAAGARDNVSFVIVEVDE